MSTPTLQLDYLGHMRFIKEATQPMENRRMRHDSQQPRTGTQPRKAPDHREMVGEQESPWIIILQYISKHQVAHFKCMYFLFANYISIKPEACRYGRKRSKKIVWPQNREYRQKDQIQVTEKNPYNYRVYKYG